jgi:hypothetical protein
MERFGRVAIFGAMAWLCACAEGGFAKRPPGGFFDPGDDPDPKATTGDDEPGDPAPWPEGSTGDDDTMPSGDDGDDGSTGGTFGPGPDDDDGGDSDTHGSSTGSIPDDPPDDGSTGAPPDAGEQPLSGPWSTCTSQSDCVDDPPTTGCLTAAQSTVGVCTWECTTPGDASDCPSAPGETATPTCVAGPAGLSICALDCSNGETCPTSMNCVATDSSAGPVEICL